MKKAFTLAEALVTMAIIGIVLALSIPVVIKSTNDTKPLFKQAEAIVEQTVNEMINDTSMYPSGNLMVSANGNTFCQNFFAKLNTVGPVNCSDRPWEFFTSGPSGSSPANEPNPDVDATTTNGMQWFDINPYSGDTWPAPLGWNTDQCDGIHEPYVPNYTDIDSTVNKCTQLWVDVNGSNKGANINTPGAPNRDIFQIYITNTGRVTVAFPTSDDPDEANILQN